MNTAKPLTISQQQHLLALVERRNAAQRTIESFLEYLGDEYDAPSADGWVLNDVQVGFVKAQQQPTAPRSPVVPGGLERE